MWSFPFFLLVFLVDFYIPFKLLGLRLYVIISFIYVVVSLLDTSSTTGARSWSAFRRLSIWRWIRSYLPITVHYASTEAKQHIHSLEKAIFAIHPHGILCFCHVFAFLIHGGAEPGCRFEVLGLAASVLFRVPVLRDFALWFGAVDATHQSIDSVLCSGKSMSICPGGLQEIIYADRNYGMSRVGIITGRKGFIRAALRHGTPIVPVYSGGEYDVYVCKRAESTLWLRQLTNRWFGWPFPLIFWGIYYTFFPLRVPIRIYIGTPIATHKQEHPSKTEIDTLRRNFYRQMHFLALQHGHELYSIDEPDDDPCTTPSTI